jgi:predicted  nucleic acid-binding Zn-ribbon protein
MIPDLQLVIQLQSLDQKVSQTQQEVSALPKHLARIEKALDAHFRKLEADRAALSANQKERKQLEGDIQAQEAKISKLRTQMLEAKTNQQYQAFQGEIDFCQKTIRKAEDRTLDLMAESEPLDRNVKAAEGALAQERQQVDAEKQRARARTAVDQKLLDELKLERRAIVERVSPKVLSTYERLRKRHKGMVVAEAVEDRCQACNMTMRPQFYQDLKKGDQILLCECCHSILYYNPPVVAEEHNAPAPAPGDDARPAEI